MEESKQFPTRHAPALEFEVEEEEEEEQQNGHRAVAVEDAPSLASSDSSSSSSSSDDDENGKTPTEKNTKKKTSTTADEGRDSDVDNGAEDDEHDGTCISSRAVKALATPNVMTIPALCRDPQARRPVRRGSASARARA